MKRRTFLGGLGALTGASMFSPLIRRAWADEPVARRYVFFVEGNGTEPINYMTPAAWDAITAQTTTAIDGDDRSFGRYYGHSEVLTLRDDLSAAISLDPLRGGAVDLTQHANVVLGLSSTVTGGGHTTNFGALSCTRSTPGRAGGPTIDAVLAALPEVRGSAPFDAVRLGVDSLGGALNTSTCAYGEANAAPVLTDPAQAYLNLFGVVGDEATRATFARKGQLLDYALTDADLALAAFNGNSAERAKLEAYIESLEAVQVRQERLSAMAGSLSGVAPAGPSESGLYASTDPLERLQAHTDLVQAALIGGLTNVAVLAVGTGGGFDLAYPSLIADFARHDIHHMGLVSKAEAVPVIAAATRELVYQAAGLAQALAAVPEGDGTMLDHTLIVVMSGNGDTHHSSAYEWPMLLLGGRALGFANDGRTTVFPGVSHSNNRQVSNLFNTLAYSAGLELDDFGAEGTARIAEGPLSELWS